MNSGKAIDDRLLKSTLVQAGVILHFQKLEYVRVFDEVSRLDRRLLRLLATPPACRGGFITSQRAFIRERADLPQQRPDGPSLGGSLLHVPRPGGLIRHAHEGAVVRPSQLATQCVANCPAPSRSAAETDASAGSPTGHPRRRGSRAAYASDLKFPGASSLARPRWSSPPS